MSRSWGHTLRLLTPEEIASQDTRRLHYHERWLNGGDHGPDCRRCGEICRTPKCARAPEYEGTYEYVTGRAGRVSWARKKLCRVHAQRWATKYGLELPSTSTAGEQHALAGALEQILRGGS